MRALACSVAVALAGCSNILGIDHFSTGGQTADAPPVDAPADQPDAPLGTPDAPTIDAMPGAPDAKVDAMSIPDAPPVADFSMSLTAGATDTPLGTQVQYVVTVTSSNFTGTVALSAEGVPPSWSTNITPASLSLNSGDMKTALFTVTIPTETTELSAPTLGVAGSGGGNNHDAQSALTIDNFLVVPFTADGVGPGAHNFPAHIDIALGASVHFVDSDTTSAHEVHADGTGGFNHQAGPMNAGMEYDVTPNAAGSYPFYCHVHGVGTGTSNLVVH